MARVAIVVALAGCNSIFGNAPAELRDARYFDVPFDAPFVCPALGGSPPAFDPALHSILLQSCTDYSFNAGHASATCRAGDGNLDVFEGPLDGALVQLAMFTEGTTANYYDEPRLSSDGAYLYVRHFDFDTNLGDVLVAERQPDASWLGIAPAPFGTTLNDSISTIAHGPTGDHVLVREVATGTLHEWVGAGSSWQEVQQHTAEQLGIMVELMKLSPNGLHLVAQTLAGMYYSDRPTVDSPFRAADPFPSAPSDFTAPLMTDDCARLYVAGLGEVFYVQQE